MPAPINPLKKSLNGGNTTFGCWLGLADPIAAEILGMAGFDWLLLDGEHAAFDMRALTTQLQILEASPTTPVVRVPVADTRIMKQVLDAGATNILVPMVESAEEARQMVRAITYPPHGDRGVGYSVTRAGGFGSVEDYGPTADAQICLMVQVENRKGLAALDDILKIEGIDGVFIGPADLAADLGHMGDLMHPEVKQTIVETTARIAAAGKIAGFMSPNDEMTNATLEAGARFVGVGSDLLMLTNMTRDLARKWVKTPS